MSKHDETLISTIAEPDLNNIGRDMTYPNVVRAVNRQNRFQTLGRVDGFDQDEASAIFWSRSRRANGQAPVIIFRLNVIIMHFWTGSLQGDPPRILSRISPLVFPLPHPSTSPPEEISRYCPG